jgi:SPP1 family predicted phage head-tail adaptor
MARDPLTIEAGTLRHAISIQAQTTTQDAFGQESQTWNTVLQTRASIRTLSLSERSSASGFVSEATHRITMRYQSAAPILGGMQIVFGSHTYQIQAVENALERNRVITVLALEIGPTQ